MNHSLQPYDLTCEYQVNPIGIDALRPRLSWKLPLARRGMRQSVYQLRAAHSADDVSAGAALIYDSGKVETDQSALVEYAGPALSSRERVWWQVRAWDENGTELHWSAPAWFEMGLLERADWQARWIGAFIAGGKHATSPAPYLRKGFTVRQPVARARLYVTALGLYECHINGRRVGEDYFAPGWTDYHKRVRYAVYDVKDLLAPGEAVLGAILGDGWYCGFVGPRPRQNYGDRPKLLAQLELDYADGSREVIATDGSWRWSFGPIEESDMLMGESYNALRELPGWDAPGCDDSDWQPVAEFEDSGAALVAWQGPQVRRICEIRPVADPVAKHSWDQQRWIFDLGQNMVGWARIKVRGKAGDTVRIRFAEMLNPDGTLYTTNLRAAKATDFYTLKGGGEEVYEPRFTFHGFQYVELEGLREPPGRDAVTGVVFHSDMPETGAFACSDPLINQLQHNIQWGQRGNFLDVPTDCPQRDERLGWTGDAQVFIRTAAFNMNVAGFFTKWVQDLEDAQSEWGQIPAVAPNILGNPVDGGPAWADAFIICPWTVYLCYGDTRILAKHYDAMARYMRYLETMSVDLIRVHPDTSWQNGSWDGFGDWLSINAETPKDLIGTAFLAYDAALMAQIAAVLGKDEDSRAWKKLSDDTRRAFQRRYVTPDGLVAGLSQTAYVLALHFDLLPERSRPGALRELVRDIQKRGIHLSTGFVGAPYLMHVLSRFGELETAFALLNQKTWPSWLYPVTRGATTIWERWDGWTDEKGFQDPGMNSFNHYAYGSIGAWLYGALAGIGLDPERPGYRGLIFKPTIGGGLASARAEFESLYGRVASGWAITGDQMAWDVTVPPNTEATLVFPAGRGAKIEESGSPIDQAEGLKRVRGTAIDTVYHAGPGEYHFTVSGL